MDCLFCKIAAGEIPSKKAYEDEKVFAFYDIDPQAPVHILVIPKEHIQSVSQITPENQEIVGRISTCWADGIWAGLLVEIRCANLLPRATRLKRRGSIHPIPKEKRDCYPLLGWQSLLLYTLQNLHRFHRNLFHPGFPAQGIGVSLPNPAVPFLRETRRCAAPQGKLLHSLGEPGGGGL